MKKTIAIVIGILLLLPLESFGFRCGGRLVRVGDTKTEVRAACGEPDYIEVEEVKTESRWVEQEFAKSHPGAKFPRSGELGASTTTTKIIETWTYDLGRYHFTRILTFEGSKLVDIEKRDYGN
ncbi:MAG TPA: DUF2845 domain-containing protein [Thermodesulfobacteriota bacterium]|nr:DUF2845 domain-containing protein [Thermodesulfobacteriota bacterium]